MQELEEMTSKSNVVELLRCVLPGLVFILLAFWWAYSMYKRYFTSLMTRYGGEHLYYWNTLTFTCSRWPNIPIEGACVLSTSFFGIIGDALTALDHNYWLHNGTAHYITIFAFFGLCGLLDIVYNMTKHNDYALPPGIDFAVAVLAFCVEAFLIQQHLLEHSPLYQQVYTLLYSTALLCAFFAALEMAYRSSLLPALGRAYFTMLQGTWLIQIGAMLYGPYSSTWDHKSIDDVITASVMYAWHMGVLAILFLTLSVLVLIEARKMNFSTVYVSMNNLRRSVSTEIDAL